MKALALAAALLVAGACTCAASINLFSGPQSVELWQEWSPRQEIAPEFATSKDQGREQDAALEIKTKSAADFGAWRSTAHGLTPGKIYRFTAWYRPTNIPHERRSVIARLHWFDEGGQGLRPPEYAIDRGPDGDWKRVEYITTAPENSAALDIQLSLGFAAEAAVLWDDVSLEELRSLPDRIVRTVTIHHRPRNTKSPAESVEQFCALALKTADQRPDLICLPEGITVVGTGKTYPQVSEPIPGPTTERLGEVARKLHSYIVAGIYEKSGDVVYNTAVLIGRDGKLVGSYRKTHLPREEWEAGITPGNDYPVFQTDFGTVGLIVCWDVQFPEPSRAMALKGAEILLLPIWGGSEVLARARAIENHVYLVSSTYDMRSFIVDPAGKILAEADDQNPIALAEIHLDQKIQQPWLGDMKTRTWKEWRPDIRY